MSVTQNWKANLRKQVSAEEFARIQAVAKRILRELPTDVPLGTLTAGLMLAAMSYAESAPHAKELIDHPHASDPST